MQEEIKYEYKSETLEHLGLVAAMFDELGIGEVIDKLIPQDKEQRKITLGQALKAMVLNGLGFANSRLYLLSQFFENKPLDRLIGPDVKALHLNDDALGRALDEFYNFGLTELYSALAVGASKQLGITPQEGHMDTTSFHVDGDFNSESSEEENNDLKVINIRKGYSRDHRRDLNQVVLNLIVEHQAKIPILMEPLSGNSSDKTVFERTIKEHVSQLKMDYGLKLIVADSACYTSQCLKAYQEQEISWIMNVPMTINLAKELVERVSIKDMQPLVEGYSYTVMCVEYAGVRQRWLVINSHKASKRVKKRVTKYLMRYSEGECKAWGELCKESYSCAEDAQKAMDKFKSILKVTEIGEGKIVTEEHYAKRGRPAKDAKPTKIEYKVTGAQSMQTSLPQKLKEQGACFILATDKVEKEEVEELSDVSVLEGYKNQKYAERGFRFLKDPMFCASTIYLKKVSRVMALTMVMTVCLLVYASLEYKIRNTLKDHKASLPDQKGKATQIPTARWVFKLFMDVHILTITGEYVRKVVLNLKPELRKFLNLLGTNYSTIYTDSEKDNPY